MIHVRHNHLHPSPDHFTDGKPAIGRSLGIPAGSMNLHFTGQIPARSALTLIELLTVIAIVSVLASLLVPIVNMLRESTRRSQAVRLVGQLQMAIGMYATEDPTRSVPPQDADLLMRSNLSQGQWHVLDAVMAMHMDGGMQSMVPDPSNSQMRVLIDPWKRPYRYQVDNVGANNPTVAVVATRPDPTRLDWNARNHVPFGYVWSLGRPLHGQCGQWTDDPDLQVGSNAPWIYEKTAVSNP
jgi:prepilin-type N-terminal cleavage/methylation domain-containing protein